MTRNKPSWNTSNLVICLSPLGQKEWGDRGGVGPGVLIRRRPNTDARWYCGPDHQRVRATQPDETVRVEETGCSCQTSTQVWMSDIAWNVHTSTQSDWWQFPLGLYCLRFRMIQVFTGWFKSCSRWRLQLRDNSSFSHQFVIIVRVK